MKNRIPSFDDFVNEARITWGEELAYNLNHDKPTIFVKAYEGQSVDIFFTKDGRSAIVTQRTSNLVFHGKDAGKNVNVSDVKYVFCGLEKEFYSPEDYKKLINAIYRGSRNPKIKPISINESLNESNKFITRNVDLNDVAPGDYIADGPKVGEVSVVVSNTRHAFVLKRVWAKDRKHKIGEEFLVPHDHDAMKDHPKSIIRVENFVEESVVNEGAIEIVYYSEVIDNWGRTESSSKPNVIAKLLQSPDDWTDDQTFEDKLGNPYDIDTLIGKTVKVGNKTFKVEESVVNEGAMSDIDLLAQDSKDFKEFVKNFKKDYKNMDAGNAKELEAWLKSVYDEAKSNR